MICLIFLVLFIIFSVWAMIGIEKERSYNRQRYLDSLQDEIKQLEAVLVEEEEEG